MSYALHGDGIPNSMPCKYGCGRSSRYGKKKDRCDTHPNKCPAQIAKHHNKWLRGCRAGTIATSAIARARFPTRFAKNTKRDFDRRDLVRFGLKEDKCEGCGGLEWVSSITDGKPTHIPLDVDNINGDPTDNRLENLRLLCKNCHALTPTYGFRKRNKLKKERRQGTPFVKAG